MTFFGGSHLGAKRLELLYELVPRIAAVAVLLEPDNLGFEVGLPSIETAARALGLQLVSVTARERTPPRCRLRSHCRDGRGGDVVRGRAGSQEPTRIKSSHWQPAMQFRQSTNCAITFKRAA